MSTKRRKSKQSTPLENFLSKVMQDKREKFEYDSLRTISHKKKKLVKISKQNSDKLSSFYSTVTTSKIDSFKNSEPEKTLIVKCDQQSIEKKTIFFSTVNASRNDTLNYNYLRESENENILNLNKSVKNLENVSGFFQQ
jgi:hypothetical protein